MKTTIQTVCAHLNDSIKKVMKTIDSNGLGIAVIIDQDEILHGTITDGDIRRALATGEDIESPASKIMNPNPFKVDKKLSNEAMVVEIQKQIEQRGKVFNQYHSLKVPVVTNKNKMTNLAIFDLQTQTLSFLSKNTETNHRVKKVLIVGGAGYLGSVLSRLLLSEGYSVKVLDLLMFGSESLDEIKDHPQFELIVGDIRNINLVCKAVKDVDAVIHLAAIVGDPASSKNPEDTIATNYLATMTLAQACKYYQVNRFIFASTCSVYGVGDNELDENSPLQPVSLYARSKIKSEQGILSLADENFSPIILRMGTLYGLSPRMRFDLVVNTFAKMATTENKITIFGGHQWRPLLHVRDAAQAYMTCLQASLGSIKTRVFNVGSNKQNYQISELGKFVKKVLPRTEVSILDAETIAGTTDKRDYRVSFSKIESELGFKAKVQVVHAIEEINQAILNQTISDVSDKRYYNS
jgi:nucleoside-diphosphate-sugar epimerase/predicted transcriptional regulator